MTDLNQTADADTGLEREYPLVGPYSRYATLYDDLGQSDFGLGMIPLVDLLVERHRLQGDRVLDLACGTGTVATELARRGYRVVGVDRSMEMLEIARAKAVEARVRVEFQQQDMASLRFEQRFDLVLCVYDSLNYLLDPRQLRAAFRGVSGVLEDRGLFIFDMNTLYCLAHHWGNQVVEERSASALLVHRYSFCPETRIGTLELFCLSRRSGRIERFREVHRERGYTLGEVREALHASGMLPLEEMAFPDLSDPDDESARVIWVATKASRRGSGERARGEVW